VANEQTAAVVAAQEGENATSESLTMSTLHRLRPLDPRWILTRAAARSEVGTLLLAAILQLQENQALPPLLL
jgi:hypothetical protein